jgi:hypothetical protein
MTRTLENAVWRHPPTSPSAIELIFIFLARSHSIGWLSRRRPDRAARAASRQILDDDYDATHGIQPTQVTGCAETLAGMLRGRLKAEQTRPDAQTRDRPRRW